MGTLERLRSRVQTHVHLQAALRREGIAAHVTAEELLACGESSHGSAGAGGVLTPGPECLREPRAPTGRPARDRVLLHRLEVSRRLQCEPGTVPVLRFCSGSGGQRPRASVHKGHVRVSAAVSHTRTGDSALGPQACITRSAPGTLRFSCVQGMMRAVQLDLSALSPTYSAPERLWEDKSILVFCFPLLLPESNTDSYLPGWAHGDSPQAREACCPNPARGPQRSPEEPSMEEEA